MEVSVTALASPYRVADSPLMARERALEQELAHARQMLDAYSNEEVRIERRVLLGEKTKAELAAVKEIVETHILMVDRLTYELQCVRQDIIWSGERRTVVPSSDDERVLFPLAASAIFLALAVAGALVVSYLRGIDTAQTAPRTTSLGWGGPLEPGQTWLYVEGPAGGGFEVDGRPYREPKQIPVSALHSHDVAFEGGGKVLVRWIPCTTAVVRSASGRGEPSVERFYNSSTCF